MLKACFPLIVRLLLLSTSIAFLVSASQNNIVGTYDYVIAGGGTAGLVLAARLTENPSYTVIVLEAGGDQNNDINVLAPGLGTLLYGNSTYDWDYPSVRQKHAGNRIINQPRGRLLGGSSAINYLAWTHASQRDLNGWGKLGNPGWSWEEVEPYFRRSETLSRPSPELTEQLQVQYLKSELHGKNGPIDTSYPEEFAKLEEAWPRTYAALGQEITGDPKDGQALGGYNLLTSLDSRTSERSHAGIEYLEPIRKRTNLKVMTGALVEKVIFADGKNREKLVATGIQFRKNGATFVANAKKEVLLCGGAFGSPNILERSGYGSEKVLKKHGIAVRFHNSNVGENLQDHPMIPLAWRVKPGVFTYDDFRNTTFAEAAYEEYVNNRTGPLSAATVGAGFFSYQQILHLSNGQPADLSTVASNLPPSGMNLKALKKQYELIVSYIRNAEEATGQEVEIPGGISPLLTNDSTKLFTTSLPGNFFTMLGVLEHPLSRGSVHITSTDPAAKPAIDPNYLSHPLDAQILGDIGLHMQKVARTPPLADLLVGGGTVVQPGYPAFLTEENKVAWLRKSVQTGDHPCGACAMLPRDLGGVVDARYRVYGTERLRVIDSSVFPIIPRGNLQSLVYAIAERGAEWVYKDGEKSETG